MDVQPQAGFYCISKAVTILYILTNGKKYWITKEWPVHTNCISLSCLQFYRVVTFKAHSYCVFMVANLLIHWNGSMERPPVQMAGGPAHAPTVHPSHAGAGKMVLGVVQGRIRVQSWQSRRWSSATEAALSDPTPFPLRGPQVLWAYSHNYPHYHNSVLFYKTKAK